MNKDNRYKYHNEEYNKMMDVQMKIREDAAKCQKWAQWSAIGWGIAITIITILAILFLR